MKKIGKNIICRSVILAAVLLALAVPGSRTIAQYQNRTHEVVNTFMVGNVDTQIVEIFNKITNTEYQKEPMVTNTGANDCYVRLRVTITPQAVAERLHLDLDSVHWVKDEADGWYYYQEKLAPGESTTPLFTTVTVDYNETDQPWIDFDMILYQEAVQAQVVKEGQKIDNMADIWALYDAQQPDM